MTSTAAQKQDFIGGLVTSILVKKGVDVAIKKGMEKLGNSPSISLKPQDEKPAAVVVSKEIKKEITDQVVHQTNAEPIVKSRVAQGSALVVVTAIVAIWTMLTDGVPNQPEEFVNPVLTVVGAAWALYGRFVAKKAFWS